MNGEKLYRDVRNGTETADQARRYADQAAEGDYFCTYGHYGCAAYPDGPCVDEVLSRHNGEG